MARERIVTTCRRMGEAGDMACHDNCAMDGLHSVFSFHKVQPHETLPAPHDEICDVAVLDMHHGFPNLGHNSIVQAVREASCDFEAAIRAAGLRVRVFSFDVRQHGLLPEGPGGRFDVYLGTGGPGHVDPNLNDGTSPHAQGVKEDPSWEERAFPLFDRILEDDKASLIAICHSFGVLCRWSGAAAPVLRGADKGGKSAGIVENVLTSQAGRHPWFGAFARGLGSMRFRAIDSRLFDLIPDPDVLARLAPLSYETLSGNGAAGTALTGVEFARDPQGAMPRVYGVNHHPEIMDAGRQKLIIEDLWERGEVTPSWRHERLRVVAAETRDPELGQQLALTTGFTFVWPLRFHLVKSLRRRALRLDRAFRMHEEEIALRAGPAVAMSAEP